VRVFFTTSPAIRGNVSVAFNTQALLSSARLPAVAKTVIKAAKAILLRMGAPTFRGKPNPYRETS
jgi:hypothetical protein